MLRNKEGKPGVPTCKDEQRKRTMCDAPKLSLFSANEESLT